MSKDMNTDKKARDIFEHEGRKYLVKVTATCGPDRGKSIMVDMYDVFAAFGVESIAIAHAAKKLLMTGRRGKGDALADLWGADAALQRAIQQEEDKQKQSNV